MDINQSYLDFLKTKHLCQDGKMRQHAPDWFIDVASQIYADSLTKKPKYDLSACISGTDSDFNGRVFFISDIHFFHENIIEYVTRLKRPFQNAKEMNAAILSNILNTVSENDILIFVGDIGFDKSDDGTFPLTNALLREIRSHCAFTINVIGNHDIDKKCGANDLMFDEIYSSISLNFNGTPLFVSHYPVSVDILDIMPGCLGLHGHTHSHVWESPFIDALYPKDAKEFRHVSVNIETTELRPMRLEELLARPGPKL